MDFDGLVIKNLMFFFLIVVYFFMWFFKIVIWVIFRFYFCGWYISDGLGGEFLSVIMLGLVFW